VASAAALWLGWVALYHLADALQAVCVFVLRCWRITLSPLLIYTALLWGLGLYGGYRLAYQGVGPWPAAPSVQSFWLASTVALGLVSVLFLVRLARAMRQPLQPSR
jgi:MATE family multidrug resistance protein